MVSVEKLGERKIIYMFLELLEPMPRMPVPFGDDVSAVHIGGGRLAVLKTDMLVGKTDVPSGMSFWQAARKAVVMNVSDFAAKGVKPLALLVSVGLPRGLKKENVEQIGEGLNAGAREYGAYVLGGDTNEASDLIISCSLFGTTKENRLMKRSGAQPGDWAAVTGLFGKTRSGLKVLLEKLSAPKKIRHSLVNSVFMPHARLPEGLALAETNAVTSSIDSSDGLAWSLHEIAKASRVGFQINHIPTAPETEEFAKIHSLSPVELTFYGGEEYELVVTVNPKLWGKAERAVKKVGGRLTKIGTVTKDKRLMFEVEDKTVPIEARGWEHFKSKRK
ncbi:MAG: thiamine-phosphate kinase [Thermoproteota archaeon]|nr:thiamine-phosphate kinase [Thermoproteota archaeon]